VDRVVITFLNYVSANPIFSAPQTSPVFSGLIAGDYTVTVIDGLGCISPSLRSIGEPTKLNIISISIRITCINDATVTLSATGGSGLMKYSKDKILCQY
jgi:hypothetical protein